MELRALKARSGAALTRTRDEQTIRLVAGVLRVKGSSPPAEPLHLESVYGVDWVAARSDWDPACLRGQVYSPDGLYLVIDRTGAVLARRGRGAALVEGDDIMQVARSIRWPALVLLADAALGVQSVYAGEGEWCARATPLEGGGAIVVLTRTRSAPMAAAR